MAAVGMNILWDYCSAALKTQVRAYIRDGKPAGVLFLDSFGNSAGECIALARQYPATVFVYRLYLGDNLQNSMTPAQVVSRHEAFRDAPPNCFWELNNEPNFAASLAFHLATMKLARAANMRVSVGAYSVGVPEASQLPAAADMLRYMAAHPGYFMLSLHEYTRGLWTVDFAPDAHSPDDWPDRVSDSTALYLMGRFRDWLDYCASIFIPAPEIFISEWGFDRVDAVPVSRYGNVGALLTNESLWRSWNVGDWQLYAAAQLKAAWKAIYAYEGAIVACCVFCWHDTPGVWHDWNIGNAPAMLQALTTGFDTMNAATPTPPTVTPYALGEYTLKTTQTHVNLRNAMSGDTGDVLNGAPVTVLSPSLVAFVLEGKAYKGQYVRAQTTTGVREGYLLRPAGFTLEAVATGGDFVARMRAGIAKVRADLDALTALVDEYESGL